MAGYRIDSYFAM